MAFKMTYINGIKDALEAIENKEDCQTATKHLRTLLMKAEQEEALRKHRRSFIEFWS